MRTSWLAVFFLFTSSAIADPFFTGNPWSPVSPGCVTRPDLQSTLYGRNEFVVFEGDMNLSHADSLSGSDAEKRVLANTRITRQLCAEPNRSALFVRFGFPQSMQSTNQGRYLRPDFWADTIGGASLGWFTPVAEQDGAVAGRIPDRMGQPVFGDLADGWEYLGHVQWTYMLDLAGPLGGYKAYSENAGEDYNDQLVLFSELQMWDEPVVPWSIPATSTLGPSPAHMPLNGRHSGTWKIVGARDQGISLSFSNRLLASPEIAARPEWSPLFLFLSWFTYDGAGRPLWLTGSGEFAQGAVSVDVDLILVQGGAFMGATRAQRSPAGRVSLSARSCADLRLDFDLSGLGLGTGTRRLERLHELEIAGYNCRDHDARRKAAYDASR